MGNPPPSKSSGARQRSQSAGSNASASAGGSGNGTPRGDAEGDGGAVLVVVDLKRFGSLLAEGDSDLSQQWRKFVAVHAPQLATWSANGDAASASAPAAAPAAANPLASPGGLHASPKTSHGHGRPGAARLARANAAARADVSVWERTLCAFSLFRLRQQTTEPEVGVEMSHLELGLKLGEGGYGLVHLARHRVSGALFAVKSFPKSRIRRVEERTTYERLERERKTLRLMQSHVRGGPQPHNLVRLICSGHDREWLRLVLPAYLGGDISKLLDEHGKLPSESVQFYAGSIVLALTQLHSLGIAYRDMKPENVLLTPGGWPVVTDFGLVAFLETEHAHATSMVGTPEFMAPEIVAGSGHGTDADWWSLGVMLCEMLTLATPFREADGATEKTYANIVHGRFTRTFEQKSWRNLPKHTTTMLQGLLKVDPQERLGGVRRGVESLRVHPFFWGLSWEALEARELIPPHAESCTNRATLCTEDFNRHPTEVPHTQLEEAAVARGGKHDAAAAALDKMFDFSEW